MGDREECEMISQRWLALREEERWWLYSKTAAEAGEADQREKGWRIALYYMLSDGLHQEKKPEIKERAKTTFKQSDS